ncbi:MAG: methionine adenosyltransferase [Bacteroidales bacterium]|nr:methionine adenosyltransferase [Bacteroidales bacterium]MDE7072689.1 methionine adenosyltransferase [Bacteroidales bacterium]
MSYLFTSESVSAGHPDKVADMISDALLDEFLRQDPDAKVACETLVTTGLVVCAGEVKTEGYVDIQQTARQTIKQIGYTKGEYRFEGDSCGVISTIHSQSPDINQGVERKKEEEQGAGDQGMMFGYACRDTEDFMPLPIYLAHALLKELDAIRREGKKMKYLRPDAKSQVTVRYSDAGKPENIDTLVVSCQHDDFAPEKQMLEKITDDIKNIAIPAMLKKMPENIKNLFAKKYKLFVNPTGKFVIGGPHGDTGLTGRKIIVDTYGGKSAHGGGAFSGKDSSKVDRSAAYAMRHIAKNLVAAGICDEAMVQVAYAIGVAQPVGLYVNTFGSSHVKMSDGQIADLLRRNVDLRPFAIVQRFGLRNPIFKPTASYGHFGRKPYTETVEVFYRDKDTKVKKSGKQERFFKSVTFFSWEKTDLVPAFKKLFLSSK